MPDNPEVAALINTANQAEASGDHAGRAAAATAALAAWKASMATTPPKTPSNAIEAGQRLGFLNNDPAWRNKVMAGDTAATRELHDLGAQVAAGDPTDLALAGVKPATSLDANAGAVIGEHDLPAAVSHLLERGYSPGHVREIMTGELLADNGEPLTEAQIAERVTNGERMLERLSHDAEWRRKYLSGDRDAAALLGAVTATIAAGKK